MSDHSNKLYWSGKFQSSLVRVVHGSMWVDLKPFQELVEDSRNKSSFKTQATLRYDGLYRWGETSQLPLTVTLGTKEQGEGLEEKITSEGSTSQRVAMNFKVGTLPGVQSITYKVNTINEDEITGEYTTIQPNDKGFFILTPTNESPPATQSPCVIN